MRWWRRFAPRTGDLGRIFFCELDGLVVVDVCADDVVHNNEGKSTIKPSSSKNKTPPKTFSICRHLIKFTMKLETDSKFNSSSVHQRRDLVLLHKD